MNTLIRYNLVGLAGVFVQLAALSVLEKQLHLHYLAATALAVEIAVLHNYWWHWKWTWGTRKAPASSLVRFQFTTGLFSILGNVFGMQLIAGFLGWPSLQANLAAIATLYLLNFAVNELFVFPPADRIQEDGRGVRAGAPRPAAVRLVAGTRP